MKKLQITAAVTFVSAWLIGLALAASGPKPSDTAQTIATYYATHEPTAMLAHLLIDGIAGAAIIALAYRAAHGASPAGVRTLFDLLNNADTVKIAFLAVMIGAASLLAAALAPSRAGSPPAASSSHPCSPSAASRSRSTAAPSTQRSN